MRPLPDIEIYQDWEAWQNHVPKPTLLSEMIMIPMTGANAPRPSLVLDRIDDILTNHQLHTDDLTDEETVRAIMRAITKPETPKEPKT